MKKLVIALTLLLAASLPASAKTVLDFRVAVPPGANNTAFTNPLTKQANFENLVSDLGMMISYKPVQPTESLKGTLLPFGFDLGVEASYTSIDKNKAYWADAVNPMSSKLDSTQAFTKIHGQIALPFIPVDLGLVYGTSYNFDSMKFTGAEIKYNIINGDVVLPAIAIRGAYTKLSGDASNIVDLTTYQADISISKGFAFITPYAGIGRVWMKGKNKDVPEVTLEDVSVSKTKGFVGAKISLFYIFNLVLEGEFANVNTYSARLNAHF